MFDTLKLTDLPGKQRGILRSSSGTRPTIWVVEDNGIQAIVKDFSTNGFFYRNIVGRFLVWRESKAYEKTKHIKGVPHLYRSIDGLALVIEKIQGKNMEELEGKKKISQVFFDNLKDLMDRFHQRGVAHCDLKRAPNIMLGTDGLPYIIDWGAAIFQKEFGFYPLNLVYRRFVRDDYMAIIKLKLRHAPEMVSSEEKERYSRQSSGEKFIRSVRDVLRYVLQKIA